MSVRVSMASSLLLLAIAGMASSVGAQVAPDEEQWGEAIDGAQLHLALAMTGPPALPGELPALAVQIRNQSATDLTANPEALDYADIEFDDVWYVQSFAITANAHPVVIAPGSQKDVGLLRPIASNMYGANARSVRPFELHPGPHRVRIRNLKGPNFGVYTDDGKAMVLLSNRITINVPDLSATAEREALVTQTSAGGFNALQPARRLIERYPDTALPAIEKAIAATADPAMRAQFVGLASNLPDDYVIPFLLTQIAPGVDQAARIRAADALLARGRDDGLWALVETWRQMNHERPPRYADEARLLEFLTRSGNPQVIDLLGRTSALRTELRFSIVQAYLPPSAAASSVHLLDQGPGASLPAALGIMRELPGGSAGAAAVERLLGLALDDTGSVPMEARYGGVTWIRPRVCDMAALVLSLRWPGKYHFAWSADAADRDRQIAAIKATWMKP